MKKSLLALFLVLNLIGCAEEIPPAPPEPQQPAKVNKWGDKFEPAVKYCGEQFSGGDPQEQPKWEAACRCIYAVAAERWDYNEYYYNPKHDQTLWNEKIPQTCMQNAGVQY